MESKLGIFDFPLRCRILVLPFKVFATALTFAYACVSICVSGAFDVRSVSVRATKAARDDVRYRLTVCSNYTLTNR